MGVSIHDEARFSSSSTKTKFFQKQDANRSPLIQGIGGAVWHGVKGFRNSPYGERRIGAVTAIKARAPVLGGNFGVWGGLFSTFDCAVKGIRKKEDPYNASMSYCFSLSVLNHPNDAEEIGNKSHRREIKGEKTDVVP
jgi:hypothetical protein